jgi:arylsulfotransferase ASST
MNARDIRRFGYLLTLQTILLALPIAKAEPSPEWTLYTNMLTTATKLVDLNGDTVHTWASDFRPGLSVFLLDNGSIMRPARDDTLPGPTGPGQGGRIQKIAWDGTIEWDYVLANDTIRQHHDIKVLPNGNVLAIVWDQRSAAEAIAMGRDPNNVGAQVLSESVLEIQPTGPTTGEIVWQWNAWDHLVQDFNPALPNFGNPAENPDRIDINFTPRGGTDPDWLHYNGIDYNAELDQVIMSANAFDEFWIVSHDPNSSGDLIYRWGNPMAYSMGTLADQTLFGQHFPHWIEDGLMGAGNILIYNNGAGRPGEEYSSADEIVPPINPDGTYHRESGKPFGPAAALWTCDNADGERFYSPIISSAQRLPNGNTLLCVGLPGNFIEVDTDCNVQWTHLDGTLQFRATRIAVRDSRVRDLLWCAPDLAEPYDQLNFFDISAFLDLYGAGDLVVDMNNDGSLNFFDVSAFLAAFAQGCP